MQTHRKLAIIPAAGLCIAFLLGTAALAETNGAQHISDTIPTTMIPGFSYSVSVTMRNSGTTTWTNAAGYRLGAVGDSDPFAPGRMDLADADSIAPSQQKTFSFTMVAPSSGLYTTDWRMVQEGVQWFGDTLTKQVDVGFGPNPPGAPTVIWPTHGMVLGSNRPDIMFQGDPCDGYEVHIGTLDTPTSNDGWDSGVVNMNPGPDPISAMSGVLNTQAYYYVFVRLHNTNGWGPWSTYQNLFYVSGQLLNDPYYIAGSGSQWQHALCYNPARNEYLVTYMSNGRIAYYRLDSTGTKIGAETVIPDDLEGAGGPRVCYNSARQEYLITYGGYTSTGGLHDELRAQRVNATNGALIAGSVWLANQPGAFKNDACYSPTSDTYLVCWDTTWDTPSPVKGQILSGTATPIGSAFNVSYGTYQWAGNPSIAYNSVDNEFLVEYQWYGDFTPQTWWDNYAQRVRPSDGALLGSRITISATPENDDGGNVAYDSEMNRYLVIYSGGDPTPWGQFISASGTLVGARFAIPSSGYFPGGMAGVDWNPVTKEYLVTWASCCSSGNFARRVSQTGELLGEPFRTNGSVEGFGNWDPTPVANTVNGEFLVVWFWQYDDVYVRRYKSLPLPPVDPTGPGPVTSFVATPGDTQVQLSWHNPSDSDFVGTMIVAKTGSYPANAFDGTTIGDFWAAPSSDGSYTHTGLTNNTTYYFCAYSHDIPNFGTAAQSRAVPRDTTAPALVTGFTATSAGNQIDLSWTNPSDSDFAGTMIRFKYTGYPTSRTDGYLLSQRTASPGSHDTFTHAGVGNATYYYSAFTYDNVPNYSTTPANAQATADCLPDQYLSDNFDSYADGNLGGQGSWTTTGAASAQVESLFVKGGAGRSVVMDTIASLGLSIGSQITFTDKGSGYYYMNLDVAQDAAGTTSQEIASVVFHGSSSPTEIAKLHIQKGKLTLEHGTGSVTLTASAANLTWYNVGIGFDADGRTMNVWLDGVPRTSTYTWKGTGTNLSRIVLVSDRNTNLSKQKAYVDNLTLDIRPGTASQVTDDGAWTPSSSKLHFSFTPPACAVEYRYCIGTTSGGAETRGWTGCGSSTDVMAVGLSLADNQTYYITVQAGTGHGTWGASKTSDGIKVAPGIEIPAAKALGDGSPSDVRAIRGRIVSACFSGCFYIQDPDRFCAIKVISSALVSEGDVVDVCGVMGGAGDERYLDCTGNPVIR